MIQLHKLLSFCVLVISLLGWYTSAQSALPPLKVVQLGDSYSAGNGARSASGKRNYQGVSGCYRSPTNWGNQFLDSLRDVFSVTYVNRACSGGEIKHILLPKEFKPSWAINKVCPSPEYPDEESYTYDSVTNECTRQLKPQIEGIDESVDLVLMTGGGNDLRFKDIIKQCFVAGPRDPAGCKEAVEFAEGNLVKVEDRLTDTFAELRSKLRPDARVVFVTYPYLVPDVGYYVEKWGDFYNAGDAIRNLGFAGDARQRAAVAVANTAAGEEFVILFDGTKELFEGHLPSPSRGKNSDRWLYEAFETTRVLEWYHYKPLGHQNLASALSIFETFGAAGGVFDSKADIDVAFVIDTTGSMEDNIAQVRADLEGLVAQLIATTNSFGSSSNDQSKVFKLGPPPTM